MINPYLTIPLDLPGDPEKGNPDITVEGKILPAQVLAYHPGYSYGTFIYLSTGQAFLTPLSIDEYEKTVKQYWKQVTDKGTNGKLKLLQ